MPEPFTLSVLSGIGSTIGGVVTAARLVYDLKNTPTDVKTCLGQVSRVNDDIHYVVILRTKHLKLLSETPVELSRLDHIIADAEESILDVGRLLEGCRREAHGGKVPFMGRMEWVLGNSTAFARRTGNLQQQHAAINVEILYLRQLEALKPLRDLSSNTTFENPELLSMGGKRSSPSLSESFSESSSRSPPPYSPNLPLYPPFQEESDQHDFVPDTGQARSSTQSPLPSMPSSNWQTPIELPVPGQGAPTGLQNRFCYGPSGAAQNWRPPAVPYQSSIPSDDQIPLTDSSQAASATFQPTNDNQVFIDSRNSHGWQSPHTDYEASARMKQGAGDDDTEAAFYRDIRMQEEERRLRRRERMRQRR